MKLNLRSNGQKCRPVEEGVGSLKVRRLPALTWLSTLGSTPKEPRACCLGANLQTVSGDRHVTVRQAVDGVEFKSAEAELKTKMSGRVGSRRRGERCSSRRAVVAGLGWLCVRRCHQRSEQQDPKKSCLAISVVLLNFTRRIEFR